MDNTTKINETTIEVSKVVPESVVKTTYQKDFILEQIVQITKQRDEMIRLKQVELDECNVILATMNELDIKTNIEVVAELEAKRIIDEKIEVVEEIIE